MLVMVMVDWEFWLGKRLQVVIIGAMGFNVGCEIVMCEVWE